MATLTKHAKTPHAELFPAEYIKTKKGWDVVLPLGVKTNTREIKLKTLRKTIRTNLHQYRMRRERLKKQLKKKKLTLFLSYSWAKYWRKVELLEMLANKLDGDTGLSVYQMSNQERKKQILGAVNQTREHWMQFAPLFEDIDTKTFAYGLDFKDFRETLPKEEKPLRMPARYISYFSSL